MAAPLEPAAAYLELVAWRTKVLLAWDLFEDSVEGSHDLAAWTVFYAANQDICLHLMKGLLKVLGGVLYNNQNALPAIERPLHMCYALAQLGDTITSFELTEAALQGPQLLHVATCNPHLPSIIWFASLFVSQVRPALLSPPDENPPASTLAVHHESSTFANNTSITGASVKLKSSSIRQRSGESASVGVQTYCNQIKDEVSGLLWSLDPALFLSCFGVPVPPGSIQHALSKLESLGLYKPETCELAPADYTDKLYAEWFTQVATAILDVAVEDGIAMEPAREWLITRARPLLGDIDNTQMMPDFILTATAATTKTTPTATTTTDNTSQTYWSNVLIVCEHRSNKSSHERPRAQLAAYATQALTAQPFRNSIFGFTTDNMRPFLILWRFDRCGALMTWEIPYSGTQANVEMFVAALLSFNSMDLDSLGFDMETLSGGSPLCLDVAAKHHQWVQNDLRITVRPDASGDDNDGPPGRDAQMHSELGEAIEQDLELQLVEKLERRRGLVGRATTCWSARPTMPTSASISAMTSANTNTDTAIGVPSSSHHQTSHVVKFSWQSGGRNPEVRLYKHAKASKVVGIAEFCAYRRGTTMNLVRRGLTIQDLQKHTPSGSVIARADTTAVGPKKTCERSRSRSGSGSGSRLRSTASGGPSERREGNVVNTEKEMEQEKGDRAKVDKDASHLEADYNKRSRTLTMIVLGSYGIALDDKSLSYAQLAHGLLAGLIGHASLFFHARILHRDVSLWNIIYSHTPIPIPTSRRIFCGNRDILHGFLIDLDFAIPWVSLRPGTKYKRVGTVPFMAVEVLEASIRHSYRHDLESFFYVTLYCSAGTREKRAKIHSLWSQPPLMEVVGEKRRLITAHGALEKFMVEIGTSAPWRQALVAIRSTLWGLWGPDCGVVYATSFDWSRVRVPGDFVKPGMGNFVAYERIREVLAWLVDQEVERERQEQLGVAM